MEYDISLAPPADYELVEYTAEVGGEDADYPGDLLPSLELLQALFP